MRIKNKITNNLVSAATYGLMIFGLIGSARTQEATQVSIQKAASASSQADLQAVSASGGASGEQTSC